MWDCKNVSANIPEALSISRLCVIYVWDCEKVSAIIPEALSHGGGWYFIIVEVLLVYHGCVGL